MENDNLKDISLHCVGIGIFCFLNLDILELLDFTKYRLIALSRQLQIKIKNELKNKFLSYNFITNNRKSIIPDMLGGSVDIKQKRKVLGKIDTYYDICLIYIETILRQSLEYKGIYLLI